MTTLEDLYNPSKGTLHLDHTHLKLLTNLSELFEFIEKHHIQTFSIQGPEGYKLIDYTHVLFTNIIKYIETNKTLIEVNLHVFRPMIKTYGIEYLIKDLLYKHPTLQRVYLSRYDQFGSFSYVIHK
jgi:hypothetical protein